MVIEKIRENKWKISEIKNIAEQKCIFEAAVIVGMFKRNSRKIM